MTANKMIPTNGKRPEGLNDDDYIHIQYRNNSMDIIKVRFVGWWDHTYKQDDDIIAYSLIQQPELYIPAQDYSKWVGKVCKFWDDNEEHFFLSYFGGHKTEGSRRFYPFEAQYGHYMHCRPVTADEIVKG